MAKKDLFDDFMAGMSGSLSDVSKMAYNNQEPAFEVTPEQREAIERSRNARRGRPTAGEKRKPDYTNKTFRISLETDQMMSRIAAVSGKSYKELLEEAVELLRKTYNL